MKTEQQTQTDTLFDLSGLKTGMPMDKKRVIWLLLAIASFVSCSLLPLQHVHEKAGAALGLVLAAVILWVSSCYPIIIGALVMGIGSVLTGVIGIKDLQTAFGNSSFLVMLGMFIVSMGADRTNVSKRIAYFFLYRFGKSKTMILLALCMATAFVSAFVSNLASTVVMCTVGLGILQEMGEEPGKSELGRAMMLAIPVFSMIGGMSLISGSPAMNTVGITTLENATNGVYTVSYFQWAILGILSALTLAIPTWWIYCKSFRVQENNKVHIDPQSFKDRLDGLGRIAGSEIRWILTVVCMVGSLLLNLLPLALASLLFALVTISPIFGTVKPLDATKSLPMHVLVNSGMAPVVALMFTTTGVGAWIASGFTPYLAGMPVFLLMLILGYILTIVNNIFANATAGIIAVCVAAFTPFVMELGLNPGLVLIPVLFMGAATTVLGVQTNMILTNPYGFWEMGDPIKPGSAVCLLWPPVITIIAYFVGPMIGMSLYL